MTQKLKITLKKSTIGSQKGQIATVKGLGLKKINSSVIREATPEILGLSLIHISEPTRPY